MVASLAKDDEEHRRRRLALTHVSVMIPSELFALRTPRQRVEECRPSRYGDTAAVADAATDRERARLPAGP